MRRSPARILAIGTTTALLGLAGSPATAAEPVTRAEASALRLSVAGQPAESGTYRVSHDGTRQTASGSNQPALRLVAGQSLVGTGTLAQNATARVDGGDGFSAACAGLAGDGATIVAVGEGDCLVGGDNVQLATGTLRLSALDLVGDDVIGRLPEQARTGLEAALGGLDEGAAAVDAAIARVAEQFGDAGLFLDLGAIQSHCTASPGEATGDASVAGVSAFARLQDGTRVDLARLPVATAPNTPVVTGLDQVVGALTSALRTQFETAFDGALGDASVVPEELQKQVVDTAVAQIAGELGPVEDNLLEATLNRQHRPSAGAIEVTALDLRVLPAAQQELGFDLVHLEAARVLCGPSGRVAAPAVVAEAPSAPQKQNQPLPAVPTAVPAGLAGTGDGAASDSHRGLHGVLGLGGLLVLAAGAATVATRRSLSR